MERRGGEEGIKDRCMDKVRHQIGWKERNEKRGGGRKWGRIEGIG